MTFGPTLKRWALFLFPGREGEPFPQSSPACYCNQVVARRLGRPRLHHHIIISVDRSHDPLHRLSKKKQQVFGKETCEEIGHLGNTGGRAIGGHCRLNDSPLAVLSVGCEDCVSRGRSRNPPRERQSWRFSPSYWWFSLGSPSTLSSAAQSCRTRLAGYRRYHSVDRRLCT